MGGDWWLNGLVTGWIEYAVLNRLEINGRRGGYTDFGNKGSAVLLWVTGMKMEFVLFGLGWIGLD